MTRLKAERIAQLIIELGVEFDLITEDEEDGSVSRPEPTQITAGARKARGRAPVAPKAPTVDIAANAAAPPPAPPTAAEPAKIMRVLCPEHAKLALANVRVIPGEPSACTGCHENVAKATGTSKTMSMEEAKTIANELIKSMGGDEGSGINVVMEILGAMGAESLTGSNDSKALDPARYEEFAKTCLAAMPASNPVPPAAPRRSL